MINLSLKEAREIVQKYIKESGKTSEEVGTEMKKMLEDYRKGIIPNDDYEETEDEKEIFEAMNERRKRKIDEIMPFEEFCEPFEATHQELLSKGITDEKFNELIEEGKKEFAEKHLK